MKVLITGGAGFIGSHLANFHLKQGDVVTVIDDLSTGGMANIQAFLTHKHFSFYKKNVMTWRDLKKVLIDVERIYHLAAVVGMFRVLEHPLETLNMNVLGSLNLLKTLASLNIKPLILFASTSEVYGDQARVLTETTPLIINNTLTHHSTYAISKLCMESLAMTFWQQFQLPCIVLRLFNTVGRNQSSRYGMVLPRFIKQALKNQDLTVFGDGKQTRSFCNVLDSVQLIDRLANNPKSIGEIVNVGKDEQISIIQLAKKIKKICNSSSKIIQIPFEKAYHQDHILVKHRRPNVKKLLDLTHYQYQWTLDQTILDLAG